MHNFTHTIRSTIAERLAYADTIIGDIVDSAKNPLTGRLWWQKSEEKWQTLACCMEIAKALESGNPSEYVSYFPVHQDGSCNGLQHYAALGRDLEGAKSVNLSPCERPQDVYSNVLDLVEEQRKRDEKKNEVAKLLDGFVKRKVIKQTVMTTVYNVTYYGAKLQIRRQLEDAKNFPTNKVIEASNYLAKNTFASIRQIFTAAREIQDWFSHCAYTIARVRGNLVKWTTPLGLPIAQPYKKSTKTVRFIYL
jgi:DNA-directed RNA polymerase, mitochondrial